MGLEQGSTRRLDVYCQPLVEHDSSIENSKTAKKELHNLFNLLQNWNFLVFMGRSNTFNKIGILEILVHFPEGNLFLTSSSEQSWPLFGNNYNFARLSAPLLRKLQFCKNTKGEM